ncbi:STT3 domain-containing protein [Nitrosophilus kaiyonis]|uniref:STT3 domain-containing protein n=1 Tax=Nitrosophilus kaiyonis TaxID=2930200 RepID=UPI002491230F|nr:STT3 domain-containing protein [Nitrosophilus kaiyonis]
MEKIFNFDDEKFSTKSIIALILIAYIFSLAVRYYWIYWASGFPEFFWNGQIMINTNDGYFFASGVQKALYKMHQFNPLVPEFWDRGLVFVTSILVKILPFSFETILLYMPGFFASLIIVPIILLGRIYKLTMVGFFAAILASIIWSYYNRTMFGYYDTDMFSVMVITFIFYFLVLSIEKKSLNAIFWASLISCIYPFLYIPGENVLYGLIILYTIYAFIFHRKDEFFYPSLILLYTSLFPLYILIKILLVIIFYILLKTQKISKNYEKYIAFIAIAIFFIWSKAIFSIWGRFSAYFFKEGTIEEGLHFYKVMQTIREASGISFETLSNRISGHISLFLLSLLGYVLLIWKKRNFAISLVFVGLGIFALKGGLRFTIYAVPFLAFSLVYLFWIFTIWIKNRYVRYVAVFVFTIAALIPNILHVIEYKVPTVFNKSEVEALDLLKRKSSPKDFVLTWWDYGYPIWFYAEKITLIDGSKHKHDNFIISEILSTSSQLEAARLSRIAVEKYAEQIKWYKKYEEEKLDISKIPDEFIFGNKEKYVASYHFSVADVLFQNRKKNQINPNEFLENLRYNDIKLPEKTREVYIYLPLRMMEIFPTVKEFSNIDLITGNKKSNPFIYYTEFFKDSKDKIYLGRGIFLDKRKGVLLFGKKIVPLKAFYTVAYTKGGKIIKQKQNLREKAPLSVIYLQSYRSFLILDDEMLNSLYIQMFVFNNYDKDLFEPVIISPWSKIFRVKI